MGTDKKTHPRACPGSAGGRTGFALAAAMAQRLDRLLEEEASLHYRDRAALTGAGGIYARIAGEFSAEGRPLSWSRARAMIRSYRRGNKAK